MQNMKSREFERVLRENGFHRVRQEGSHVIFERKQTISVPLTKDEVSGPMAKRLLGEIGVKLR